MKIIRKAPVAAIAALILVATLFGLAWFTSQEAVLADEPALSYNIWPEAYIKIDGEYSNECFGCSEIEYGLLLHANPRPSEFPISFTAEIPTFSELRWAGNTSSACVRGDWHYWAGVWTFHGYLNCKSPSGNLDFLGVKFSPVQEGVLEIGIRFHEEGSAFITRIITLSISGQPEETPTPSPTSTKTSTFTPSPTRTSTRTPTGTATATRTRTRALTPTPTRTLSPTKTRTETRTKTPTTSPTPSATATKTLALTETPTATATETMTATPTVTPPPHPVITNVSTAYIFPGQVITITGENFGQCQLGDGDRESDGVAFRSYYPPNSTGGVVNWEETQITVVVPEGHANSLFHTIFIFKWWEEGNTYLYSNEWPIKMARRVFLPAILR